jgi:3-deoxy-7-phosphoheptulonate synthase
MNYTIIKKLPSPEELIKKIPLSEKASAKIIQDVQEVKNIIEGKDKRLLIVIGPCAAWPQEAVLEYAQRLKNLELKVKDNLKIVMRVFIQKPRTSKGWTGPINQPNLCTSPDIEEGMYYCRKMMVQIIELGLPIADEALFTHNARGFIELLSLTVIGARSMQDQEHRVFASGIDCAVGIKNPTSGSIEIGINGVSSAQNQHVAIFYGNEVQTHGNQYAHLVLRGGEKEPNYSIAHFKEALEYMQKNNIKNPAVMVDASHDNSKIDGKKFPRQQIKVIEEVLEIIKNEPEIKKIFKGFIIESFLKEGNQKIDPEHPENLDLGGLSVVDPCLGWEETEKLLLELNEKAR